MVSPPLDGADIATSTIPTLKANLATQLQARPGLSGIQVSYGPPLPASRREYIWLGDVAGQQEYGAMASPNARHEQYELEVVVAVLREGTRMKETDERCFTLFGEVESQLRTDPTVNNAVTEAHVGSMRLTEFVDRDGGRRFAQLVVQVPCQVWI